MLTGLHGVYRHGKIEIENPPESIQDDTPVIVTFLIDDNGVYAAHKVDLRAKGIDKKQARALRSQLASFGEDWDSPEMNGYDNYDAAHRKS